MYGHSLVLFQSVLSNTAVMPYCLTFKDAYVRIIIDGLNIGNLSENRPKVYSSPIFSLIWYKFHVTWATCYIHGQLLKCDWQTTYVTMAGRHTINLFTHVHGI